MRISAVPYAEEEIPSGDSTPSASGLDSRCSPRSWLTSGGPSSRRLVEYQKVSGRPTFPSRRAAALRVATIRAFRSKDPFGRQRLHITTPRVRITCGGTGGAGVIVADVGRTTPYTASSPAWATLGADGTVIMAGSLNKTLASGQKRPSHDRNTGRRAQRPGGQQSHAAPVAAAPAASGGQQRRDHRQAGRRHRPAARSRLPARHRRGRHGRGTRDLRAHRPGDQLP